ncbi:MAG: DUF2273 domain-containing protein [Spirochaetota bacterium]|nr:DUF2273 domain-containing protein [Spirochaetota bacterium]
MLKELNNSDGFIKYILNWINGNPGKAVGIISGFIFGILLFTVGLYKTLLILLFMLAGYFLGRSRDENISLSDQLSNLFRKKDE